MIIEGESEYMFYMHERNKVEGEGIWEEIVVVAGNKVLRALEGKAETTAAKS